MILGVCRRILGDDHAAEDAFQATFLVLVRRARMVPWRESLGGWLHGTARRVALRARRAAGVSRLIQQQSAGSRRPLADPDPSEAAAARELRRVLDQELQGLPAKLRAPLVLCDLEGKTHEQAARELGWPKGSLAKRLNGARELLRVRLRRRGVAPADNTAHDLTAVPSAALAAAALLAAHGGASTAATALAKGVVKAMWLAKMTTATVLVMTLLAAGTVAGVGAYRAWEVRAAAPAPAPNPPPPAVENKDKDTMPIDKAVVYHVGLAQGEAAFQALTEGAAVVTDRPEDVKGNVQLYLAAFEKTTRQSRPVPIGSHLAILAVGPMLNSGDEAVAVALNRRGGRLELEMAYTSGEAEGKEYTKNIVWRPLVQVPVDLAVGRYQLRVTWQARKSLPAGEAWNGRTDVSSRDFVVVDADRQESKAVRVNGADFVAFAESSIRAPAVGEEKPVDLGLKIVNRSDKSLAFYSFGAFAKLKLLTADGKEAPGAYQRTSPGYLALAPVTINPGKEMMPFFDATLHWTPDGKKLQLHITNLEDFDQLYDDIKPGKYLLTAEYALEKSPDASTPFWTGTARTEPVAFEILDAPPNASKPVRVEGLEFTAQRECASRRPHPAARPMWTSKCASSTSRKIGCSLPRST